ncbi:hypothetical protein Tco_1238712 [Tanacetum coccineum]
MANFGFNNQVSDSTNRAPFPPQQDIVMTNAATKTTAPEFAAPQLRRRRLKSAARRWGGCSPMFRLGETVRVSRDMSLEKARLELRFTQLLFGDMSLNRMEAIKYDMETLEARVDVVELRAEILQLALADAREEIMNLRNRVSALEQGTQVWKSIGYGVSMYWIRRIGDFNRVGPRTDSRIFLDRYGVLVFRTIIFKLSSNLSSQMAHFAIVSPFTP